MEDLSYTLEQCNTDLWTPQFVIPSETYPIQDCNGQQGTTGLVVPPCETYPIQDCNGQQGTTGLLVPPCETYPIQDCNGQQGTTGLLVPLHLQTKQHQLSQPKSPRELRRSRPKATLTEYQKKENKRKSDKKYRQKKKDIRANWEREKEELISTIEKLMKRQAREESSANEGLKMVGLPTATVSISSLGPPQFGTMPPQLCASSSTVTEFAPPTSIAPNLTTVFPGNVSNNRLIFFNSSTHLPLKLTPSNFSAWRQQLQALLICYGLIGFVDGSIPSPPATPAVPADPNSYFNLWQRQDQLILHLILISLTESMLPHLSSAQTSRDAWVTLHNLFADNRLLTHESLQRHNNVELPVVVTANVAQGNTVQQADSGASFGSGASNSRRQRQGTPPVTSWLLAHEESLQRHNNVELPVVVTANVAQGNTVQQADSSARFGSGAGNWRRTRRNTPPHGQQEVGYNTQRITDVIRRRSLNFEQDSVQVCQFCDSNGHVAKSCPKLATHPLIKCVTSQTNDIGANTHATKSLVLSSEYEGTDSVVIDNVTAIPISHVVRGSMYGGMLTTRPE